MTTTSRPSESAASGSCCTPGGGCCGPEDRVSAPPASTVEQSAADQDRIRSAVREGYSTIARSGSLAGIFDADAQSDVASMDPAAQSCCGPAASGGCCGAGTLTPDQIAEAIGYTAADLAASPHAANMGLSCGNPTAIASLRPGEVVLDLGSGGGFDCFIAGRRVGPSGRVIGVDMTPDMVSRARRNVGVYRQQSGLDNVEFRLGEIEHLPVADSSVDVVISNCVLNLSPDKPRVWREIARVLRPGGRVAISDLALLRTLPEQIRADVVALVGCVAGAVPIDEVRTQIESAGLALISVISKPEYIDAMTQWEDPLYRRIVSALPPGSKASDYITSLDISARR